MIKSSMSIEYLAMRFFSTSICFLLVTGILPPLPYVGAIRGADTISYEEVQAASSLWTRQKGQDWPRMLGVNYDSRSTETGIIKRWPASGLGVKWTADTGVGYGNGVASQGRWFQFDRFGNKERLTCYHAETGSFLWKWESAVEYRDAYGYNNGPRCSPVVDGDRVYVYGVAGKLACLSIADGSERWSQNTNDTYNVLPNFFGVGASPLVYQDKLLVMVGGSPVTQRNQDMSIAKPSGSAMVAFDKNSGKELYRVGNYLASYSAPVIQEIHGRNVCLAFVREGLLAFDPADGSKEAFFPWRAKMLESVNAASPIVWRQNILLSETYERGSVLLGLGERGLSKLWQDGTSRKEQVLRAHWSTPLLDGDYLYASSGRNEPDTDLRCIKLSETPQGDNLLSTAVQWTDRNRDRMTGLLVDGHALMLGESGLLQLIQLEPSRRTVVSEMSLATTSDSRDGKPLVSTPCWAPPVLSHGLLYVRGADKVVCLELIPE
jgi:outer membrane protein assembly factor BamB